VQDRREQVVLAGRLGADARRGGVGVELFGELGVVEGVASTKPADAGAVGVRGDDDAGGGSAVGAMSVIRASASWPDGRSSLRRTIHGSCSPGRPSCQMCAAIPAPVAQTVWTPPQWRRTVTLTIRFPRRWFYDGMAAFCAFPLR